MAEFHYETCLALHPSLCARAKEYHAERVDSPQGIGRWVHRLPGRAPTPTERAYARAKADPAVRAAHAHMDELEEAIERASRDLGRAINGALAREYAREGIAR